MTFDAACEAPRFAQVFLVLDGKDLESPPKLDEIVGLAELLDTGTGALTRRLEFRPVGSGLARLAPDADTQRTFSMRMEFSNCASGSGIAVDGAGVDVIGTR